jgi:ABC-type ATPase involved in cell division
MKKIFLVSIVMFQLNVAHCQIIQCLPFNSTPEVYIGISKSINNMKIVRVNFHFMQNGSGSGNFTEFIPLIINAMKEQNEKIIKLEREIETLKQKK